MDELRKIKVSIRRQADLQSEPRFEIFEIVKEKNMSVLDVMHHIQSKLDPSLAFRYSCRAGMCGTCSMRVNGKNRWTCRTSIEDLGDDITIEVPLTGGNVSWTTEIR